MIISYPYVFCLPFRSGKEWTSVRTFSSYPTQWRLSSESFGFDLTLKASFNDQEFVTIIAKPAFWEGRVEVEGTYKGSSVTGLGYIERNGFNVLSDLKKFFKAVGKEVRAAVRYVYPDNPTFDEACKLVAR